ncbi:MAG: DUF4105 domain-containing protein [Fermentimonas sp.]|nr:DUF4105 domain-containing protein [Fermentimonas sp.]
MKKYILKIVPLILILFLQTVNAQVQLHDNARVSLLTASEWHGAVYALFGHTAIRVLDDSSGVDAVFNYGYFDSSQPNFMYNFVRGKTDYVLGVTTFNDFMYEYEYKGQSVTEQVLNLTTAEKQQLFNALYINSLPENMRYRYNYLYDNCATRPRDMIEEYVNGTIIYPPTSKTQTFRDLLHECTAEHKWTKFGIDLMVGSTSDRVIDVREKMFIPSYLMGSFEGAVMVVNDTLSYPLVENTEVILDLNSERNSAREQTIFTPFVTAFALLLLSIIISLLQLVNLNKVRPAKIYDTLLFGGAGIGSLVLLTLMFFSEHPATNPNWNFVWLNTFALIAAVLFWVKSAKKIVYFYHFINFAVITLFILLWWLIPQQLPIATIPFSLSLMVRSGTNIYMQRNKKIKNSRFTSSKHMKAGWGQ